MESPEVRLSPDGNIAVKTGAGVAFPWFIFNIDNGGHYSDGVRDKIEGDDTTDPPTPAWKLMVPDAD